ncbi:hypothetical protein [Hoeflea poritis]|uniref:Heme-copper oxidase subunit III family profile domain-containing protein n=1 Tax=Hoeflea poritis TaxID=2993659 RepID=A0ABT4VLZ9_9HYPH|nr:hypothetical protein [Hoeflea poritis]MDA4845137.1 hypothetical protein [Hoeflea poritis]
MSSLETSFSKIGNEYPSPFRTLAVAATALFLLSALWGFFDTRLIDGSPVWMKPLKFALSLAILFGTLEIVERRLSERVRNGWTLSITVLVMTAAFLSEMAYIFFQAAQAEDSHFNYSTPFHEFMYTVVMAGGAVALVACVGLIGWLVKRDDEADLSPVMREAIWLGFILSFVLTMIVAGFLSSNGGRFVGIHPEGAPTIPLFGWSGVTGDLRPAHFLSLHAMQVLPLLAFWLERRKVKRAIRVVRSVAVGYTLVTLTVFSMALAGIPLIPLA